MGINSKKINTQLDEILKNENIDNKGFSSILKETNILKDNKREVMPNFSSLLKSGTANDLDCHKRFRNQKSIFIKQL